MYDLDDLLAGRDRFCHRLPNCACLDGFDKIPGNRQRNVGLKKRDAHFPQRGVDVSFRQRAGFGQSVKDTTKAF